MLSPSLLRTFSSRISLPPLLFIYSSPRFPFFIISFFIDSRYLVPPFSSSIFVLCVLQRLVIFVVFSFIPRLYVLFFFCVSFPSPYLSASFRFLFSSFLCLLPVNSNMASKPSTSSPGSSSTSAHIPIPSHFSQHPVPFGCKLNVRGHILLKFRCVFCHFIRIYSSIRVS